MRHKEAIHSGHFMVSDFEAEAEDEVEIALVSPPHSSTSSPIEEDEGSTSGLQQTDNHTATAETNSSQSSKLNPDHRGGLGQAFFLCAPLLSKKENVHLFSSSLPRFDKCQETSRIFPRTEQTFASARSFGVIS